MNPLSLRASGLGRFADVDLDIPTGTVALVGPNGAGKSTLLNAIELALFADGSRDLATLLGPFTDRLELELTFEHAGETYRVRRGYRATGSGGKCTLDFETCDDDVAINGAPWLPLTRETAAATQELICQTIGLSRRTFRASAFLVQGDAGNFPEASPVDRKAILGAILDPHGLWPRLADRAKLDAREAEKTLELLFAQAGDREERVQNLPALEVQLAALQAREVAAKADVAASEEDLDRAQAALAAIAAAAERVHALTLARDHAHAARAAAATALDAALNAREAVPAANEELTRLEITAALIPDLEQRLDEQRRHAAEVSAQRDRAARANAHAADREQHVRRLHADAGRLTLALDELAQRIDALQAAADEDATCDRCGQHLGADARAAALVSLAAERERATATLADALEIAAEADEQLAVARAELAELPAPAGLEALEDIETPLAQARAAAARVPAARLNAQQLEQQAAGADELAAALRAAETELAARAAELHAAADGVQDNAQLTETVAAAKATVTTRRATLETVTAELVRGRQTVEQLQAARAELVTLHAKQAETNARLDLYRLAERAYGRDGIPALIAENIAVPLIEAGANEILERMPLSDGTVMRVELHTQRELKTADHLRETLDIRVSHRDVTRLFDLGFPPSHSGGESFRVSFALRWSLAKLMRNRVAAEIGIMLIDEPDGLDAAGMDSLAMILREEAATFPRVMLVSHNPQLATAFEQMIEVEIVGGVSRLVAGDRVAVAA